jgi:hypothetical protein
MQHTDERLQIHEPQDSASGGEHDKRIGWSEIRPSRGKRADLPSSRVLKEHSRLSPGTPLSEEGKLLAGQGMERMGDGEAKLPIWVMGCS